jgi:hypothetical protein
MCVQRSHGLSEAARWAKSSTHVPECSAWSPGCSAPSPPHVLLAPSLARDSGDVPEVMTGLSVDSPMRRAHPHPLLTLRTLPGPLGLAQKVSSPSHPPSQQAFFLTLQMTHSSQGQGAPKHARMSVPIRPFPRCHHWGAVQRVSCFST